MTMKLESGLQIRKMPPPDTNPKGDVGEQTADTEDEDHLIETTVESDNVRRSGRIRPLPAHLRDYELD